MKKQEKNKKNKKPEADNLSKETLKVIYETNYSQLNKMLDSITDMDRKLTSVIAIDSIALPLIVTNTPNSKLFQFLLGSSLLFIIIGFFYAIRGLQVKTYKDSPDPKTLYDYYYYEDVKKLYMDGARNFAEKYRMVKEQSDNKKNIINESFWFSSVGVMSAVLVIFASKIF